MKYTKEQLEVMSDFEVSKAICVLLGFDVNGVTESWNQMINAVPNLCEDWSKLMPLAVEHGVTLKRVACPAGSGFAHYAESYCGLYHTEYMEPPQRAIACCLILVLQEK